MTTDTLADTFARELAAHAPGLGSDAIAAHTAAALAIGAYTLGPDGRLAPGAAEAIANARFLPRTFVKAMAERAVAAVPEGNPLAKSLAWFRAMGLPGGMENLVSAPAENAELATAIATELASLPKVSAQTRMHSGMERLEAVRDADG